MAAHCRFGPPTRTERTSGHRWTHTPTPPHPKGTDLANTTHKSIKSTSLAVGLSCCLCCRTLRSRRRCVRLASTASTRYRSSHLPYQAFNSLPDLRFLRRSC